ncbi:RAD51-associated protein 1 [Fukomys damarensis]|uniref:RAD51-associated protein 1 n=1 Tax=Fukomys damarensis TaxID=885580 RepID=A0A091DDM5_FUKDA|nr:RAD51-associated protein 1 [Fukomys damarensis]
MGIMVLPVRNKKPVNYSQFENSDRSDDFISATLPLSKKSRIAPKELKEDKPKPNLKNVQKENMLLQEKNPNKRMALHDKIFQRGLDAALALSVKDHPVVINDVQKSQDKSIEKPGNSKTEIMNKFLHISNCRIWTGFPKKVMPGESKGKEKQHLKLSRGGWAQKAVMATEPGNASGEGSENDSDFDESEDNGEDFTCGKSKVKENKKKEMKAEVTRSSARSPKYGARRHVVMLLPLAFLWAGAQQQPFAMVSTTPPKDTVERMFRTASESGKSDAFVTSVAAFEPGLLLLPLSSLAPFLSLTKPPDIRHEILLIKLCTGSLQLLGESSDFLP